MIDRYPHAFSACISFSMFSGDGDIVTDPDG